jgi:hypothetical protein
MGTTAAPPAAVGFTVKSGWAAAVLLLGPSGSPRVADSRRIELSDPAVPESRQPYHAGFATARESGAGLARLLASVRRHGNRSVALLLREYRTMARTIAGAGLVVGSLAEPDGIANDHIRIHALEGQLFRGVIRNAAEHDELPCSVWRERDLYRIAVETLRQPEENLRATVAALGRTVSGPWRAEHKSATLAAWLVLASFGRDTRSPRAATQSA